MTGPKLLEYCAMVPMTTGWPTGPQVALPTMPSTSVGTPLSSSVCGATICT
jgi:hypothetical protein